MVQILRQQRRNRPRQSRLRNHKLQNKNKGQKRSKSNENYNPRGSRSAYQRRFRLKVLERDQYKCVICGEFQEKGLRVHHIFSWNEYKELRMIPENGITMCKVCHDVDVEGSFHNVFGEGNNDIEQFTTYYEERTGRTFYDDMLQA